METVAVVCDDNIKCAEARYEAEDDMEMEEMETMQG